MYSPGRLYPTPKNGRFTLFATGLPKGLQFKKIVIPTPIKATFARKRRRGQRRWHHHLMGGGVPSRGTAGSQVGSGTQCSPYQDTLLSIPVPRVTLQEIVEDNGPMYHAGYLVQDRPHRTSFSTTVTRQEGTSNCGPSTTLAPK